MSQAPEPRRRQVCWLLRRLGRTVGLALLALSPGLGCGREFFRQWADQDVTEAVFEKSRDPRWKLNDFSIDQPAMSRFADPYDPDHPPAPPDDYATEALSPYPQKPAIRMLTPVEGTGYLEMLAAGKRYDAPPPIEEQLETGRPDAAAAGAADDPLAQPPASTEPGPFQFEGPDLPTLPENFGTEPGEMTPIPNEEAPPFSEPDTLPDASDDDSQTSSSKRDPGVLTAAFQDPAASTEADEIPPEVNLDDEPEIVPPIIDDTQVPESETESLIPPPITRPGAGPEEAAAIRAATTGFAAQLSPEYVEYNQATTAALPANSRPYVVGPAEVLQLALINSRAYQFQIENVYLASLSVTLARFGFEPQFFAGMSPVTAPSGGFPPGAVGSNTFVYRTREAPGGQLSQLTLSEAAGFGKLFVFGGRVAGAFANQMVFNFIGRTPSQPAVQSSLPLSFVQPILRGAGRAVILEPLTLAERTLLYAIRDFARFRQLFFVATLTSGQAIGSGTAAIGSGIGGASDPSIGFLQVLQLYQVAENSRVIMAAYERALEIYREYAKGGASSGISQLQVDQIDRNFQQARQSLITAQTSYRIALDQFKQQLGLPPDVPMIPDRGLLEGFRRVFRELDDWQRRTDHDPAELDDIIAGLPRLDNIVLDGRPLFDYSGPAPQPVFADPERQEEFLLVAERIALENRVDLMNQRAILYDIWRQIAVSANALLPVLTVSFSNQILTPPTTTNPFGFNSQSLQSNLSLQAELPLIRVLERNNFRTALINYQRQRRNLMSQEDSVKFQVRQEIRTLIQQTETYEIAKRNLLLAIRQRDQSLQQIIAPPTQAAGGADTANQATQTINFINAVDAILAQLNSLISLWVQYQTTRLALYRDLGIMPYDEWEAYYELFPASAGAPADEPRAGGPAAGRAPEIIQAPPAFQP